MVSTVGTMDALFELGYDYSESDRMVSEVRHATNLVILSYEESGSIGRGEALDMRDAISLDVEITCNYMAHTHFVLMQYVDKLLAKVIKRWENVADACKMVDEIIASNENGERLLNIPALDKKARLEIINKASDSNASYYALEYYRGKMDALKASKEQAARQLARLEREQREQDGEVIFEILDNMAQEVIAEVRKNGSDNVYLTATAVLYTQVWRNRLKKHVSTINRFYAVEMKSLKATHKKMYTTESIRLSLLIDEVMYRLEGKFD